MNRNFLYLIVLLICTCAACTGEANSSTQEGTAKTDKQNSGLTKKAKTLKKPDCDIAGKFLEGNELWLKDEQRLLYILADSTSEDKEMGESHRVLAVYDTKDCKEIERQILPINVSPDFPYYIADINYNNISHLVAIKGFQTIYCYDVKAGRLLEKLEAQFKNERMAEDAQSGMIKRLEVWESYLIGFATSYGSFVFKLKEGQAPEAVLPAAEFALSEGVYNSLFLLESANGNYQAIFPSYDFEGEKFKINPLFQAAKKIDPTIPSNIQDNRFLILKESREAGKRIPLAIDMKAQQLIALPSELETAKTQEILKWVQKERSN